MKTLPDRVVADISEEHYVECQENWKKPEADRFGTWHDWSASDIDYLVQELRNGYRNDYTNDKRAGWLLAVSGLQVAQIADTAADADVLGLTLSALREGLLWALDSATDATASPHMVGVEQARAAIDQVTRILKIIDEDADAFGRGVRFLRGGVQMPPDALLN